jgi:pimeloyl-ACP methyl ester carboxylesterase
MKSVVMKSLWFSPLHSLREIVTFFKSFMVSAAVLPGTVSLDDRADGTRFDVPPSVVQGSRDLVNTPARARAFFDEVQAPDKEFLLIEEAGHFALYRRPDLFLAFLRDRVLPTLRGRNQASALD